MKKMSGWGWTAVILLIIGGLNWGLIGLFKFDLVASIFGMNSSITRLIYILVGLSAIWKIFAMSMKDKPQGS